MLSIEVLSHSIMEVHLTEEQSFCFQLEVLVCINGLEGETRECLVSIEPSQQGSGDVAITDAAVDQLSQFRDLSFPVLQSC